MENPFIVTGKIRPECFCDRVEESTRLERSILSGGENVVIISPRRMGKTGLINFCFEKPEVKEQVTTLMVDILRTSTLQEFTYLLGRAVFKTLGSRSQQMMKAITDTLQSLRGSFGYDPIKDTPTFDIKLGDITHPAYTLEEIFDCLEKADQHCVVAFDEFQQIVHYPDRNVEALLRTHIQQSSNANFIFAGSERHIMDEMFLGHARPFYQSATIMALAPITQEKRADTNTARRLPASPCRKRSSCTPSPATGTPSVSPRHSSSGATAFSRPAVCRPPCASSWSMAS